MRTPTIIPAFLLMLLFFGCSQAKREGMQATPGMDMESMAASDTTSNTFISSSAAIENKKDTTHRFIRTADLKFKVKSVIKATYAIEDLTNKLGGFVTYTKLESTVDYVNSTAVSTDSSLETTHYTVANTITLRVPNTKLDTTLKLISKNIDYLDYRIITAEDVALQMLGNSLTQKRAVTNEERLTNAIDRRGKMLPETTTAEELLSDKKEKADNAKIANLSLADQIQFSTINLSIYQRQTIKREVITNDKNITAYEPGFGRKLLEALKQGWELFQALIIFLARLWWLFLSVFVGYFIYKNFGQWFKK